MHGPRMSTWLYVLNPPWARDLRIRRHCLELITLQAKIQHEFHEASRIST
jgi:hypothetical protein